MLKNYSKYLQIILTLLLFLTQAVFYFTEKDITTYTISFISSSAVYLLFAISLLKFDFDIKRLWLLIIIFFLLKILFINTEPIGSDDYYRYIWDGKVQANGINPFLYQPNSVKLNSLHSDLLPDKVSYPYIKTIYFPVAQWIFVLAYKISGENAIGLKLIYLLFEFITLLALYYMLKRYDISLKYILIYATLPLITFQFFIDAHIDIVGTALMIASIAFYFYNKKLFSYLLLGLSVSVKPTGLLLLPLYYQNEIGIREKLKSIIIPIFVFIITFLPYMFTATPLDTLVNYSVNWTFNGMVFNTLSLFINNNYTIRIICGILFLLIFVYLYFIKTDLIKKIYLSLFLLMLFSPVVHPWYLVWFAVLLPVVKSYSGIYFVSIISLTLLTVINFQTTGVWNESGIILLIEYIPLIIIFLYEIFYTRVFNRKDYFCN